MKLIPLTKHEEAILIVGLGCTFAEYDAGGLRNVGFTRNDLVHLARKLGIKGDLSKEYLEKKDDSTFEEGLK